jgi:lactoylglutathione lyase
MHIDHIAVWVADPEKVLAFYLRYFACEAGNRYHNPAKGFSSVFVRFGDHTRIELMKRNGVVPGDGSEHTGWAHIAIRLASAAEVDSLTARMAADGCMVAAMPRVTGDGYYESVVLDPENNRIELTSGQACQR